MPHTPDDHGDAVVATLKNIGVKKAVIAGHLMGCIVAINIAYRHPGLVRQLALFGAPLYKQKPLSNWWRRLNRAEGLFFPMFEAAQKSPDFMQAGGKVADELVPFIKGMKINDETWLAYKKSLEFTIMQYETYKQTTKLRVPALYVNGWLDLFVIRRNIEDIQKANPRFVTAKNTFGPHEVTPHRGRVIARIINGLHSTIKT